MFAWASSAPLAAIETALAASETVPADRTLGRLGVALAIGLLVGMQRQFAKQGAADDLLAGARSFALIGLAGGVGSVLTSETGSDGILLVTLGAIGVLVAIGYAGGVRAGGIGLTTEVAAVVTFLAGALAGNGHLVVAVAVAVATTALLALKPVTRDFVTNIDDKDVEATLKFAVLAALILPVLPRDAIGPSPFDAASPFKVGVMMVFILGLSFLGYVLIKFVGPRRGIALTGVLGGLVSSTAVTLTMSERSRSSQGLIPTLSMALLLAWSIMYARVLVEVGVVNAQLLTEVWLPIGTGGLVILTAAGFFARRGGDQATADNNKRFSNPFSLGPAIQFGLLYGVVLIGSKAASEYLGDAGVYVGAIASGLADVDAITLSMAELSVGDGAVDDETAGNAIVLAAASNTLVKAGMVVSLADPSMRRTMLPVTVVAVVASVAVGFAL